MFTQKAKLILALYKSDREIISVYSARTARLLCISRRLGSNGTHGGLCVLVGQSLISALTGDAFSFLFPLLSCLWHYVHEVHLSLVIPQTVFEYNTRIPGLVFETILFHPTLQNVCPKQTKCWFVAYAGTFFVGSTNKPPTTGMLFHRHESLCRVTSLHHCIGCRFPSIAWNNYGGLRWLCESVAPGFACLAFKHDWCSDPCCFDLPSILKIFCLFSHR